MRLHISNARQYVEEQMREAADRPEVAPSAAKSKTNAGKTTAAKTTASKTTASWGGRRSRATLQPRR
jgi:hypothetical protein